MSESEWDTYEKTVVTFGLISGVISSLMMVATVPFADRIGFDKGAIVGYTAIVLSFCWCSRHPVVPRQCWQWADHVWQAFAVGISITVISCIFYV